MDQKLLEKNVFAFHMSMNDKEDSELIFGWIDPKRYIGEMKWYPVVYELFWAI